MARIGLMGGSFNPIHHRHLALAKAAKEELMLDSVLFIPTGNPPHKHASLVDAKNRYEMTCLAVIPFGYTVSDIETNREGTSYSVDTLTQLKAEHPENEYIFIIGEDTLHDLPNWRKPDEVFRLCSFAVCCRSSNDVKQSPIIAELKARGAVFSYLSLPPSSISSTAIRSALTENGFSDDIPPQVMAYIQTVGLYGLRGLPNGYEMLKRLSDSLSQKRYLHSLLVAYTAIRLAALHGISQEEAGLAGILHDCAKCMPLPEMQRIAEENEVHPDLEIMTSGNLLHGPVGAIVARESYGITNEAVLRAIACHTTGRINMSKLDMLLFLSDKTEPGRAAYPMLNEIRSLSRQNLSKATLCSLESSRAYVLSKGYSLYHETDAIIQWLKTTV